MKRSLLIVLPALAASTAFAQSEGNNEASERKTSATPPVYRSAFEDYRVYREPELVPWQELNDEMGRLRGHVGHLKEAESSTVESTGKEPVGRRHEHHGAHR